MTLIRRTKTVRLNIESEHALMAQIAMADVIETVHRITRAKRLIWKRPVAEAEPRDVPTKMRAVTFEIHSESELRDYQRLVDRIKHSEGPNV